MAFGSDPLGLSAADPTAAALVNLERVISYGQLADLARARADELGQAPPGLLALGLSASVDSIVTFLAALGSERAVLLLNPSAPSASVDVFMDSYRPTIVFGVDSVAGGTTTITRNAQGAERDVPPYVLLTTSGSTGSPKLVRLTPSALASNAHSIAAALQLSAAEIAPLTLPLFYSYGLSVLTSHLHVGATVVLTQDGVTTRDFWHLFDKAGCTSFAGVPYTYAMLQRLRFQPSDHTSLRTMTQAGGKLDLDSRQHFFDLMESVNGRFVVMYGQTEATARMAVLPHERLRGHENAVGWPIPGGAFKICTELGDTDEPGHEGEVVYFGPNVMHGYAESADDLSVGDVLQGRLPTGDRGYLGEDGCLWLTGREKRIAKVFGARVSLDDVEAMVRQLGHVGAAIAGDDALIVFIEGDIDEPAVRRALAAQMHVHRTGIVVRSVPALPLLPSGKIDLALLSSRYR